MPKGDECDLIIEKYQHFIDAIEPNPLERKVLENAWSLFKKIKTQYLEANSADVKKLNFSTVEMDLDNWI